MPVPIIDRLVARGAVRLDVPLLQPAEPFLELAGEDLRRRVFLSEDERGRVRCLRPELTIPAARAHIASGTRGPVRYALAGTVFRQRDGMDEFPQCGIEAIGGDTAEGDARAIADAVALVDELARGRRAEVIVGDRAIYAAALGTIGLSPGWIARLVRLHGDEGDAPALSGTSAGDAPEARLGADPSLPADLRAALHAGDRAAVETAVATAIATARMGKGSRTATEIAARLVERHGPVGAEPNAVQIEAVERLKRLDCPLDQTATVLPSIMPSPEVDAGDAARDPLRVSIDHNERRVAALREQGIDPSALTFRAALGRSLDYYTGLVFEIRDAAGTVLAAGGRYDRLLGLLGGADEPAVGFALWLDRLGVDLDGRAR